MRPADASTADAREQQQTPAGDAPAARPVDVPLEAEPADVLEQAQDDAPAQHVVDRDLPLEADPADAAEQAVVVHLDEEEGRA